MLQFKKFSTEKWVGTGLLIFVLAAACTAVFDGANPPDYQRVKPIFNSDAQKLGIALGESIKSTFRQAKEKSIDFSDKAQMESLAYQNSLAELERAGLVSEEDVLESAAPGSVKAAAAKQKPLSESQKKVMQEIEAAVQNSRSYLEFTDKLANINNGLALTVPAKEQLGLQRAIAALYYTMDAIDDLVAEGILKGTAEKTQRSTQIQKAGFGLFSDYGIEALSGGPSSSSWWDSWGKCAAGILGGALMGSLKGASIGTKILPGKGTVIGAIVGAVGGGLVGARLSCD